LYKLLEKKIHIYGGKMKLSHTDDAGTQTEKMLIAINEIEDLTKQLIVTGKELNEVKGRYAEIKAKIKLQKEKINGLKITIRAEAVSQLS
jgi:peptidoglycan hydrolase CwlO-like protein